jgi:hypothetical protein
MFLALEIAVWVAAGAFVFFVLFLVCAAIAVGIDLYKRDPF